MKYDQLTASKLYELLLQLEEYFDRYPVQGYATSVTLLGASSRGGWFANVQRYASCD